MINLKNTQKKVKINLIKLKSDTQKILDILKYPDFDLGIWLTTDATIHKYNREYRGKDKPTDILSFPNYPDLKAGQHIKAKRQEDKNLGDLIIAPAYAKKDAANWNQTFEQHLQMLLVHGICHLLGYDHIKDEDYKIMHRKELAILKKLKS